MECLAHKDFLGKFGEIWAKFLRTHKNLPALALKMSTVFNSCQEKLMTV